MFSNKKQKAKIWLSRLRININTMISISIIENQYPAVQKTCYSIDAIEDNRTDWLILKQIYS